MFGIPMCHEVARLIATGEIERKSPWVRFLVRLHLRSCDVCANYARQLKYLAALIRQKMSRETDPEKARRLAERITQRLMRNHS